MCILVVTHSLLTLIVARCASPAVGFALVFFFTPLVVALSHAKFWIPARYKDLERIERRILRANVKVPFTMTKVAGLGTVHVPCTSSAKAPKTLVLVHGFAAGNALWACVRALVLLLVSFVYEHHH